MESGGTNGSEPVLNEQVVLNARLRGKFSPQFVADGMGGSVKMARLLAEVLVAGLHFLLPCFGAFGIDSSAHEKSITDPR